jgi:TonB family protein
MTRKIILSITFIAWVFGSVSFVNADSWSLPKKRKYYSPNKKYYLEVTPKKLRSQLAYFEDKVEGNEDAGARKDVKNNRANSAFYVRRADGRYSKKREFPLLNEVSPVSAVVSDRGDYFVTFDNWHRVGYGNDAIVIYRSDGTLVKNFGLDDLLTQGDIETFPRSVSSRDWGGEHYIDETNGHLVLKVVSNGKSSYDVAATFHDLKIELASGQPLEIRRDLFPQPKVIGTVSANFATESSKASAFPGDSTCSSESKGFDSPGIVGLPSEQFFRKAIERPLPPYPAIAMVARAHGTVVIQILTSNIGDVICVRPMSGHPLFMRAALDAARKWKFEPFEVAGQNVMAAGTIAFNFITVEKNMNPNSQSRD